MSIEKFSDGTRRLAASHKLWLVHGHHRAPGVTETARATVVVFETTTPRDAAGIPHVSEVNKPLARRTGFGRSIQRRRVNINTLRAAAGHARWREAWRPRLRKFGEAVIDIALLSRALSCVSHRGYVSLEVFRFQVQRGDMGYGIRVIGDDWRIVLAGRRETDAPPLLGSAQAKSVTKEEP